jgi:1-pyrroline-5-carboxylate dehydrogenase
VGWTSIFPRPANEPVRSYASGSAERMHLKNALAGMAKDSPEIPLRIGGESVTTPQRISVVMPHDHQKCIGHAHGATTAHVGRAIQAAQEARNSWAKLGFEARASIFLKAADLLAGPRRDAINASSMLGQSKTVHQSEVDAACELVDFWRFSVHFAAMLHDTETISAPGTLNRIDLRPLDGFVLAISPFNFTSIAANLATAPALMGNTVVWKPAPEQMRSALVTMEVLEAAGLPAGVINCVTGDPEVIAQSALTSPELAGVHFTGSTKVFQHIWTSVGRQIGNYRQYPRVVGETGGKDFIFAHPSADVDALRTAIVRGGFEYQGQKCSAVSRVYVPRSLWRQLEAPLVETIRSLKVGDVQDFGNFMGALIHERAFKKVTSYIDLAQADDKATVLAGGTYTQAKGWFVEPTLVQVEDPQHRLMKEEIFGPVVTVFVYENAAVLDALRHCERTSPYGLTGAVFARDRLAIEEITEVLRFAAGNFYINDKPTGAVVGQQPFGGGRQSGTNDKSGTPWNLMRWVSPRVIKENFLPPTQHQYPYMEEP